MSATTAPTRFHVVAGTHPYPWPYDGALSGTTLALVLAGWDEDWAARAVGEPTTATVTRRCAQLAGAVHAAGGLVVAVAHRGASPLDVDLDGDDAPVGLSAAGIDAFHGSAVEQLLRDRGCTTLLIAGHGLEGPVHSTMRSANDRGLESLLVVDACSALTTDCVAAAESMVCMSGGVFGAVGDVDAVLAALSTLTGGSP